MRRSLARLGAIAVLGASVRAEAEPPCAVARRELASFATTTTDGFALRSLSPYVGGEVATALVRRAAAAGPQLAFELFVAAGLSGEAEALRALRSAAPPPHPQARLGRSLALLALGDGDETSTIAVTLESGPIAQRLDIVTALARMHQPRPRELLYRALDDAEPEIRLVAAEALVRLRSAKGKRVLLELARSGAESLKIRAARALGSSRYAGASLDVLPESIGARASVRLAAQGRADVLRRARVQVAGPSAEQRAAGFAALVLSGQDSAASLEKLSQRAVDRFGPAVSAELAMAVALLGEADATERLGAVAPGDARAALDVLWAYAAADVATLEPAVAAPILAALEKWMVTGALADADQSRALEAASIITGRSARGLARARLLGPDGSALRTAARVLGEIGVTEDVPALLEVARRVSGPSRVEAFRGAQRRCAE